MIETILPIDTLSVIFSFLDKKSLRSYDTSMLSKINRPIFLESLSRGVFFNKDLTICSWSIRRGLKSNIESSNLTLIKYVSDSCKKLTIYGRYRENTKFSIKNDNIECLYIDFAKSKTQFRSLKAKNLESLVMIYPRNINKLLLIKLSINCPKLQKICFFKCGEYNKEYMEEIIKTNKIKIICRY